MVSPDGKRIAGRGSSGETVIFDMETQKTLVVSGIEPQEQLRRWQMDGQSLVVATNGPGQARVSRIEMATGKRTLMRTIDVADKAGVTSVRAYVSPDDQTYAYDDVRILTTLYVVEGLK